MKKNGIIVFILLFILVFAGCNMEDSEDINIKLYYNNKVYNTIDDKGRSINSSWIINNSDTEKVKVRLGSEKEQDKFADKNAFIFKDKALNMFILYNDILYCEEDYSFPDYRSNSEITEIILTPNQNTGFFDKDCIVITNPQDIEIIKKYLQNAGESNQPEDSFSKEKPQTEDYDIGIVFSDFPAVFYYGYISIDYNNKYGIYCADLNRDNYIYTIDNELLNTLGKYEKRLHPE